MKKRVMIFILISILLFIYLPLIKPQEITTKAVVEVNRIYELDIEIDILNEKVLAGQNLSVFIELEKTDLADISDEILVDLDYEIFKKKKKRKIVESGFLKTINITNEKQEIIEIPISSDLKGKYALKIIASNPQSFSDEDKDKFKVRRKIKNSFSGFIILFYKNKLKSPNLTFKN